MKQLKKFKNLRNKRSFSRRKKSEHPPGSVVPKITNETISVHREDILSGARKYIYPLQHAKHRIITITVGLLIFSVISFFAYCTLALYRFHSTSGFLYKVTQVIPFPIAKAGDDWVSYESYLFEVRRYTHYYETQQKTNFEDPLNAPQLESFKQNTLDKVVDDAYIKKLAAKYNVTVSQQQIDEQISVLRVQNRLGNSDEVFEDVLRDYWGWSVEDFRRSLHSQLLSQNVIAKIDTETNDKAAEALKQIRSGADFGEVVAKYSDDKATNTTGGDIGIIERNKRDVTSRTAEALFTLKPGEVSEVINIGFSLEIVKNIESAGENRIHAAHLLFNFKDKSSYLNDLKDQQKPRVFIKP